jgi:ATP-binding cassette subfamily C protein CydC
LLTAQRRVTAAHGWFDMLLATAAGLAAMLALLLARGPLPMAALAALGAVMMIDGAAPYLRGLQRQGNLAAAEERLDMMLQAPPSPPTARLHRPAPTLTLSGITLAPGALVGIQGPSGCGKTTLIEQMLGLRDAQPGRVQLDGVDAGAIDPAQRRACFAYAPQNAALLAGTVRDNLRLGAPEASDPSLWAALHDAALDERVRALPACLDSWIGEDGARLSGGERRRLSLARTLLRPAPWLLLDEPTEGLDAATEARVMDRLAARLAASGQGALIISHRPVPLMFCANVFGFTDAVDPDQRQLRLLSATLV